MLDHKSFSISSLVKLIIKHFNYSINDLVLGSSTAKLLIYLFHNSQLIFPFVKIFNKKLFKINSTELSPELLKCSSESIA